MAALRRKFKKAADPSVDAILAQPLARLRMGLAVLNADKKMAFSESDFQVFVQKLYGATADPVYLNQEMKSVLKAMSTGRAPDDPNITRPETQLLWAAALVFIMKNREALAPQWTAPDATAPITETALWNALTTTPRAIEELVQHAFYVTEATRNPTTKLRWGKPGSWFYFSPSENIINSDFLISLIGGFEHTRGVLFHEIGHSQLTVKFLPTMLKVKAEIDALHEKKKAQNGKLSKEEYIKLRMLNVEWKLRFELMDKTENAVVNRYATNMGNQLAQDYGYSLNQTATTISGFGRMVAESDRRAREKAGKPEAAPKEALSEEQIDLMRKAIREQREAAEKAGLPPEIIDQIKRVEKEFEARVKAEVRQKSGQPSAAQRLQNIHNAINLVFFKNNEYFPNTKKDWLRIGVNPDWIRRGRDVKASNDNLADGEYHADFQLFLELCGGAKGLEHLQPAPRDRLLGRAYYNKLTDDYADQRNAIAERIWDEYIEPFIDELRDEVEEQIKEQMEQKEKQKQDGQEGEPDEGDGQDGEGQESDGEGKPGKKGKKGKKGKPGQGGESGDPSDEKDEGGEEGEDSDNDADGEDADGDPKDGKEKGKGKSKKSKDLAQDGVSEDEKVDVDGVGDMPDIETPPDGPGEGKDADAKKDKDGKDGKGKKGKKDKGESEGKTLEELMEELERRKKEQEEKAKKKKKGQDGQDADGDGDGDEEGDEPGQQAGEGGKILDIEDLADKDWSDYSVLLEALTPMISQVARIMKEIRKRQVEKIQKQSRSLEQLPQDNEIRRLDQRAHRDLIIKQKTGQEMEDRDLNRFRKNKTIEKPTTMDIVVMIDGSGSMDTKNLGANGRVSAMHVALSSAIVLYEASKHVDANVYICMWGNDDPILLAQPGDDNIKIGENLAKAIKGLNSGTSLAPSFGKMVKAMVENKEKGKPNAGYSHFMVLSDGDIFDSGKAEDLIEKMFMASKYFTLDFAIIKKPNGYNAVTQMEALANKLQSRLPHQRVDSISGQDPEKLTIGIIGMLLDKLRGCNSFIAVPKHEKRSAFRRALISMDVK